MAKTAHKNKAGKLLKVTFPLLPADNNNSKLTIILKDYLSQKEIETGSGSWVSDIRKVRKWGPIWSAIIGPWLSWYVFVALDTFVR